MNLDQNTTYTTLGNVDIKAKSLSPYLNYDPSFLSQSQPDYILLEGQTKQRGRFELAFGQIGTSAILGGAFGGINGLYYGLKTTTLAGQTGKLRKTQILNHVMKNGSASAQTLGVIAVMYSTFGVIYSWARGDDDDWNTLAAAASTGLLYKSTSGLRKCAMGGAVGLGLATAFCLWTNKDKFLQFNRQVNVA